MKKFEHEERVYNFLVENAKADREKTFDAIEAFLANATDKELKRIRNIINYFMEATI